MFQNDIPVGLLVKSVKLLNAVIFIKYQVNIPFGLAGLLNNIEP